MIPRFKISFGFEASNILKELGLKLPLCTKMVADHQQELYVSQIIHKSFIEVNEQGTKAAAASAVHLCVEVADSPLKKRR
jgi:serpin B